MAQSKRDPFRTYCTWTSPSLSPNGKTIAFLEWRGSGAGTQQCRTQFLITLDIQSGKVNAWAVSQPDVPTTRKPVVGTPQWSPDSRHLAVGTAGALYLIDTNETSVTSILDAKVLREDQDGLQVPIWDQASGQLYVAGVHANSVAFDQIDVRTGHNIRRVFQDIGNAHPLFINASDGTYVFFGEPPDVKQPSGGGEIFQLNESTEVERFPGAGVSLRMAS